MDALQLLQLIHHGVWVALAAIAVVRVARRPTRTSLDIALFFAGIALFVIESRVLAVVDLPGGEALRAAGVILVVALPYLLLRILDDFAPVRPWIMRASEASVVPSAVVLLAFQDAQLPLAALLYVVAAFAAVAIYSAAVAVRVARGSSGVTRSRMRSIAAGAYFLGLGILVAGVGAVLPAATAVAAAVTQLCAVASALSFFVGFAPPGPVRRYWQIPELRGFLARASTLPRTGMDELVREIEEVAGRSLGARAAIGLWDETAGVLRFARSGGMPSVVGPGSPYLVWRSFAEQSPVYVSDAATANPAAADEYRRVGVGPVLLAPITAGERRLGVLAVTARREPIFAEEDLEFVRLMAQQAAVLMESRTLIDEAARVRAQEETARLKEDFVSAAAHDLKTPLTTIVAQAQLIERRAEREGRAGELPGIRRLVSETLRLSRLVEELLDASRLERGAFEMMLDDADLAAVVREVATYDRPGVERIKLEVAGPLRGRFDARRMAQLVDNLIDNALKYSPAQSSVEVRAWSEDGLARVAVRDAGIGIPPAELPDLFNRFRRASNVDHRRYGGIGLGLFICRGIAEQHGGRIWVETELGRGSVFQVEIPLRGAVPRSPGLEAGTVRA